MNTGVLNIGGTWTLAADQERALRTQHMYANSHACHSHESIKRKEHIVYHITLYICSRSSWSSWEAASVQLSSILGPRKDTVSFERAQCKVIYCHLPRPNHNLRSVLELELFQGDLSACSSGFFFFFLWACDSQLILLFPDRWEDVAVDNQVKNHQESTTSGASRTWFWSGCPCWMLSDIRQWHTVSGMWPWTLTCQLMPSWYHGVTSLNESQNSRKPQVQKASWVTPRSGVGIWKRLCCWQHRTSLGKRYFLISEHLNNMLLPRQHEVFRIVFLTGPVAFFGPLHLASTCAPCTRQHLLYLLDKTVDLVEELKVQGGRFYCTSIHFHNHISLYRINLTAGFIFLLD